MLLSYTRFYLLSLLTVYTMSSTAQQHIHKPSLTPADMEDWPVLYRHAQSPSGKYFLYTVKNRNLTSSAETLHVQSMDASRWHVQYNNVNNVHFSTDGAFVFFIDSERMLNIQQLGTAAVQKLPNVSEYETFENNGTDNVIIRGNNKILLYRLNSNTVHTFPEFCDYRISKAGKYVAFFDAEQKGDIILFDVRNNEVDDTIAVSGAIDVGSVVFSNDDEKLAFYYKDARTGAGHIAYYTIKQDHLRKVIDDSNRLLGDSLCLSPYVEFLSAGMSLVFTCTSKPVEQAAKRLKSTVNVYTYHDKIPYSEQLVTPNSVSHNFKGVIHLANNKIIYTENGQSRMLSSDGRLDDALITVTGLWLPESPPQGLFTVLSADSGQMVGTVNNPMLQFYEASAGGDFLIFKDANDFVFYNREKHTLYPATKDLPIPERDLEFDKKGQRQFSIQAYVNGTSNIILSDNYDLWMIDMNGDRDPNNLTNGYGRKKRILFKVSNYNFNGERSKLKIIEKNELRRLLLSSYSYLTANNDYYWLHYDQQKKLERCTFGGYMYESVEIFGGAHRGNTATNPLKKPGEFLVVRQSASEAPNLFSTTDFKKFKQLTYINPEKRYNWMTSKVLTFPLKNGRQSSGVLYQPENFDSTKRYPVIFYCYQQMMQDAFYYATPALSFQIINVPYYVSNDYLVFAPDLPDGAGMPDVLQLAFDKVMGAADFLSGLPYVDSGRLAIHGGSWGGHETNYVIAHTGRFAAAVSAAGTADMIAKYGIPSHGRGDYLGIPWLGSNTYGEFGSLSENLDLYIENSAKVHAKNVTTPVLFMHNQLDQAVQFYHSLGFFNSLAHFKKKAWLLSYDNEGHRIDNYDNQVDYTIRLKQFFDHYLMNKPAPRWMTHGIPYRLKQVDDGYSYDETTK